jgi:hypothetical protein
MARTDSIFVASFLVILGCLLYAGCLAKFPHMSKTTENEQNEGEHDGVNPASSQQVDRKPVGSPDAKDKKSQEDKSQDRVKQGQAEPKSGDGIERKKPEDEAGQVKAAALELAKILGNIKKAKICYAGKDKEWWAIYYQDIESAIDVRQFFWNSDTEKLEPFLVLKRIPQAKMDSDFKKEETGKTCSEITLPAPSSTR